MPASVIWPFFNFTFYAYRPTSYAYLLICPVFLLISLASYSPVPFTFLISQNLQAFHSSLHLLTASPEADSAITHMTRTL
jgi:hypothetical protein